MFSASSVNWEAQLGKLQLRTGLLISGKFSESVTGETRTVISPRDGKLLPELPFAQLQDVDVAVESARAAFESGIWSGLSPRARGLVLQRFAELVFDNAEELAATISLEMGKPVREALQVEMRAVVNTIRWYGEAADKLVDESPVTPNDVLALVTREPVGVVAAIVPWNFPLTMAAWKIAPALMAGNSVILKPSENSPYSALRLGELALEAGIPAGVLNVIPGEGHVAGAALGSHLDVDVIAFTGSNAVGMQFLEYSAQSNGKRVWLELGGKTASLVLEDADLEAAVVATASGCFYNQGQMCTAASRLLVPNSKILEAREIAARVARESQPADPFDLDASQGAIVSSRQLERVAGFVNRAISDGADLIAGSPNPATPVTGGSYFSPAVLANVRPDSELAQTEVFGPVLAIIGYDDLEDGIRIANSTPFGLAASIWTNDLSLAHKTARRIQAGVVWVNCFEEGDMTLPFGGVKRSGYGRDKSLHAIEKFTNLKSTWIQL